MKLGKHSKAVKRFGPRYGKRTRERLAKIESMSKINHKCPYCSYESAKRVANGIFYCKKCSSKFTGRAYMPIKQKTVKHVKQKKIEFEDELFTEKKVKSEKLEENTTETNEAEKANETGETEEIAETTTGGNK
ncbi:MAG: hypothetical protein ACOCQG_00560 [Candidatus Nanoarchaeia archaeon]